MIGEGGAALILEEYEHAVARGAHIYAEIAGGAGNCDAYHMTAPDPDGAYEVMLLALEDAGMKPEVSIISMYTVLRPGWEISPNRQLS